MPRLVDPFDESADLDRRARSYLQANCVHCHQFGGGGSANFDLRLELPIDQTKALDTTPVQGTFGIADARILAPGDPYRSVLFYRMAKLGSGRMPHLGSSRIDERALQLIHDWIRQFSPRSREWALVERLRRLDEPAALARERANEAAELRQLAGQADRAEPNDGDRLLAAERANREAADRAAARARDRAEAVTQLLSSPPAALVLARAIAAHQLPEATRQQALTAALAHADGNVRDLFERFVPEEQRARRLGDIIRAEEILALAGDPARGRELFMNGTAMPCKNCHRVGDTGSTLGPDLTQIGKKYNRTQLLETILEPSKTIEPKYATHLVETKQGQVHAGILAERTVREVVLRTVRDTEVRVATADIAEISPFPQSLMPEGALRDLTAAQAADLIAFLESLK
jgi:putative heme-binding domain-containing protein